MNQHIDVPSKGTGLQECSKCVLGRADEPNITFDVNGICRYCQDFETRWRAHFKDEKARSETLAQVLSEISSASSDASYDCVVGISGGVDSTYLAYKAVQLGLRPLAVHFDNGWNSEIATQNIHELVGRLDIDLFTYVVDWPEFKDLQIAYLEASVVDAEIPTDHGIYGCLYRVALEKNIPYILSGNNETTEGVMPSGWNYKKKDFVNVKDIHHRYGKRPLKTYPILDVSLKRRIKKAGIKIIELLNLLPYEKQEAMTVIQGELGWRDYGGKHYESVWTRFYQGYILPSKFGIDKRKAHVATLINSGQMSREEALLELEKPIYPEDLFKVDRAFVLKKLGLSEEAFDRIMSLPIKSHYDYAIEGSFFEYYPSLRFLRPSWRRLKKVLGMPDGHRWIQFDV